MLIGERRKRCMNSKPASLMCTAQHTVSICMASIPKWRKAVTRARRFARGQEIVKSLANDTPRTCF